MAAQSATAAIRSTETRPQTALVPPARQRTSGHRPALVCNEDVDSRPSARRRRPVAAPEGAPREPVPGGQAALGGLVAAFAHELRAPLGYVGSTLDLIEDSLEDLSHDELRSMFGRMRRGTVWMENLVENLSSATLLEFGRLRLHRRPIPLRGVLEAALELVQPLLDRRGQRVVLSCPDELLVDGDETRLGQVFVNLLVNAHRYSMPEDEFQVRVSTSGDCVLVRVEDHGPGIPFDEQRRIFQRYARGRDASDHGSGMGLGLSIVQALVDLHDGSVTVQSAPGRGACFVVRLPRLCGGVLETA